MAEGITPVRRESGEVNAGRVPADRRRLVRLFVFRGPRGPLAFLQRAAGTSPPKAESSRATMPTRRLQLPPYARLQRRALTEPSSTHRRSIRHPDVVGRTDPYGLLAARQVQREQPRPPSSSPRRRGETDSAYAGGAPDGARRGSTTCYEATGHPFAEPVVGGRAAGAGRPDQGGAPSLVGIVLPRRPPARWTSRSGREWRDRHAQRRVGGTPPRSSSWPTTPARRCAVRSSRWFPRRWRRADWTPRATSIW